MNYFVTGIFIIVIYMCVYSIVDRVCKCAENCAMAKAFGGKINVDADNNNTAN